MKVQVINAEDAKISGVRFAFPGEENLLCSGHFEWRSFPLETMLRTNKVISGILQGWHRTVEFDTLEYHDDTENFYFTEGTCIMPFGTRVGDSVDPDSLQLVRIRPGTQVEVKAGKLHYVPIPLGDTFALTFSRRCRNRSLCSSRSCSSANKPYEQEAFE